MKGKITEYEIINHGWNHSQYFQGCSATFTNYSHCVTGIGINAKEAYEDCLDNIASSGFDTESLPKRPNGIRLRDKIPAKILSNEENECWWFVSIRFNVDGDE